MTNTENGMKFETLNEYLTFLRDENNYIIFLEKENESLRKKVAELKDENELMRRHANIGESTERFFQEIKNIMR